MPIRKKKISEEEARLKMADLCARSEQCAFDIKEKLYRLGLFPDQRERIISFLEENRFIDENRFARSYARDKVRFSGWGPFKIRQGLLTKRIDREAVGEAIDSIEDREWEDALRKASRSKARQLDLTGEKARDDRLKLFRFLLSRGFASEDAKEAVREEISNQRKEEK